MRTTYRIRPEVIDRARERLGCTSDEKLAAQLGTSAATIARVRRGESPSLGTTIALLNAAAVDLPAAVEAA